MDTVQISSAAVNDSIRLITPEPRHLQEMGHVCFDAFRCVHDRHGFPRDFPDLDSAVKVVSLIRGLDKVFAIAAEDRDQIVGSNFLLTTDEVGGVGPISIHPEWQGNGLGRRLMQAVLDHATERGVHRVRLLQDSFNTASLSLYASLGFDVQETVGVLRAPSADLPDSTVRLASSPDFEAMSQLCRGIYRVGRKNEVAEWSRLGIPTLVRESGGRITGYLLPGMLGHGVAETQADALALIRQVALYSPPGMDLFFVPLRNTVLYRAALKAGARLVKVMTLMSWGPYQAPKGIWMPSVLY